MVARDHIDLVLSFFDNPTFRSSSQTWCLEFFRRYFVKSGGLYAVFGFEIVDQ